MAKHFLSRNYRRSVFDRVKGLLLSPPTGWFNNPYIVYGQPELEDTAFRPNTNLNFVFLVDKNVQPVAAKLPLIVVEVTQSPRLPFELGNHKGHLFNTDLNIWGRHAGERDDLAYFFQETIGDVFSVLDYGTTGSPVQCTAQLIDDSDPQVENISTGPDEKQLEGSLYNFSVVSFAALTQV